MKSFKRILCMFLIVAMLLAIMPSSVFAASKSGKCGENLKWTLASDGVLTIQGTGKMYDCSQKDPGWSDYSEKIKSVVIKSGVTSVGKEAFHSNYPNLEKVTLPSSVKTIGDYAFDGCALESVNFPSSLESIGDFAFAWSGLLRIPVELPKGLKEIGYFAFGMSGITSLTIPASVESIEFAAFENCDRLITLTISRGSGDMSIEEAAFDGCNTLATVKLGESVKFIGNFAFGQCPDLKKIYFYGNAPKFEDDTVFTWCESTAYVPSGNSTWTKSKMKDYGGDITWKKLGSEDTVSKPAKPSNVNAVSSGYNSVKVSWNKVSGATGYTVYRATSKSGTYKAIKSTTSLSYKNSSLTTGKAYYYKVRAYKTVDGKKVYGSYSSADAAKPVPAKASTSLSKASSTSIKVSWKKVSGASGYEIYRSTSKSGTYKRVKSITSGSTLSYKNTGLTKGKTYYYKVRAYRTVKGERKYGSFSAVKSYKLPKSTTSGSTSSSTSGSTSAETVYITPTGAKYHRQSCSTLRDNITAMNRAEAEIMYDACKICKP